MIRLGSGSQNGQGESGMAKLTNSAFDSQRPVESDRAAFRTPPPAHPPSRALREVTHGAGVHEDPLRRRPPHFWVPAANAGGFGLEPSLLDESSPFRSMGSQSLAVLLHYSKMSRFVANDLPAVP